MARTDSSLPTQGRRAIDFEWPLATARDKAKRLFAFLFATNKIKGIDLAPDYQKDEILDVEAMRAAGYLFAFVQVNRGLWAHPNLMEFCAPLFDAGFPILTYALFYGALSGKDQANFHLDNSYPIWQKQGKKLPAALDIEVRDNATVATRVFQSEEWFRVIREEVRPAKYCSPALNKELLGDAPLLFDTIGYDAHWTPALEPTIPTGWTREKTLFWQYGVATKYYWCPAVPGMKSDVDVDYFYGTYADLLALDTGLPFASRSLSPSPSPSPEPEEEVDLTKAKMARNLLNEFIAENETKPPWYSASPSPSPSAPIPPAGDTWIMTIKAVDRAKTWTYQVWNPTQGRLVEKWNSAKDPGPFPIMQEYFDKDGDRLTIKAGTKVETKKALTNADGSVDFYQLIDYVGDRGQILYVAKYDVAKPY